MKVPDDLISATLPLGLSCVVEFWSVESQEVIHETTMSNLPRVGELVDLAEAVEGLGSYYVLQTKWVFGGGGRLVAQIKLREIDKG